MSSGEKNAGPPTDEAAISAERNRTRALLELSGSQLKALLLVASDSRLQAGAPSKTTVADAEGLLAEMCRVRGVSSTDLLQTATNETTSVEELIRIKDVAKVFMKEAEASPQREAARLLYHATVAAAFVHHAATISGRAMHKQQDLYERLAAVWAGDPIGELFREAAARVAGSNPSDAP